MGPASSKLFQAALLYIGAESMIPQYIGIDSGPYRASLVIGGIIALIGWRRAVDSPPARYYLVAALLFGWWLVVSSIAAWTVGSPYDALGVIVWVCLLVPGIAHVVRDEMYRRPLILGLVGGATVYGVAVGYRLLLGRSVTDAVPEGQAGNVGLVLERNRNIVAMGAIVAAAIIMERPWTPSQLVRWPLVALAGLTVAYSGGRSALVGLALFALLLGIFQPGVSRRLRRVLFAALVGAVFVFVTQAIGGQAATSSDRLLDYFSDNEKSLGDKARELDGRKAWNLGLDHPFFGVGFGNYKGAYHPVLEEADGHDVRERLEVLSAHNTYGLVLAEHGFPGVLAFIGMFGTLAWAVVRRSYDRALRFVGSGVVAVFFMLTFDGLLGTVLYIPMALLLGTAIAADERRPPLSPAHAA